MTSQEVEIYYSWIELRTRCKHNVYKAGEINPCWRTTSLHQRIESKHVDIGIYDVIGIKLKRPCDTCQPVIDALIEGRQMYVATVTYTSNPLQIFTWPSDSVDNIMLRLSRLDSELNDAYNAYRLGVI